MCPCMYNTIQNINTSTLIAMALFLGIGIAVGLFLLSGTFYLIWRFIRSIEKKDYN